MMRNNKQFSWPAFIIGIFLILVLIHAGGTFRGNRIVFPTIKEIADAFLRLVSNQKTYEMICVTLAHLIGTLVISMAAGTLIGVAEGLSVRIRCSLMPVMTLIRSLPMIVLVILIMTMFSYSYVPVIAATVVLTPLISEAVNEGCRSIDPEMKDVYRLNSGFNAKVLFRVYLPMISGYLKQAFFNAAGMGLKVIVSAEYLVQAKNSLGKAVYSSTYFLEYADIYAYAIIMIILVFMITEVPVIILKRIRKKDAFFAIVSE